MSKQIKWGCIQPLTGGMYLGAQEAIGHPAEWIISYKGLNNVVKDKDGNITNCTNEYNLTQYLKKHNCMPPYYIFNERKMFDINFDYKKVDLVTEDGEHVDPDYNDIDLVLAVPVCSGLSTSTICDSHVKYARNCNMLNITYYTVAVIKPKVYIFENAPTLMGTKGDSIRFELQQLAEDYGYTIAYYKTDTHLHHNCQKRPRTFILFFRKDTDEATVPVMNFENAPVSIEEFLSHIPADASQQDVLSPSVWIHTPIRYMNYIYGKNWRDNVNGNLLDVILKTPDATKKFLDWVHETGTDEEIRRFDKYIGHIEKKRAEGKGWWVLSSKYIHDYVPACMHKNIFAMVHVTEDRLYTIREWLTMMGMPYDFEMQGRYDLIFQKIGQNVPAGTAKYITNEALRYINGEAELVNANVMFYDNIKQKIIKIE